MIAGEVSSVNYSNCLPQGRVARVSEGEVTKPKSVSGSREYPLQVLAAPKGNTNKFVAEGAADVIPHLLGCEGP
jgi:hypothetical protein